MSFTLGASIIHAYLMQYYLISFVYVLHVH